ncbi:hypothetical protein HMPREF9441_01367 [Paraprevotella clara YIT 11840]|uniref:Uncharacterized protein n=1 Tax=Paraprevotella clara YIT 11840 TaxID=762968 RepID=G5SPT3_9BACT|nr:hypothetical protein HMPREF9441_01367 [Paraprevotella clara YIT 11840]
MRWIFFVKQLNTNILQSFHKKTPSTNCLIRCRFMKNKRK